MRANGRQIRLIGPDGDGIEAAGAVFCAGLWSDRLAVRAGRSPDPRIVPFRGGYLRLRPSGAASSTGLVYPVPDPALPFLGVHLTPQIGGEVVLGPSALLVGARDAYGLKTVRRTRRGRHARLAGNLADDAPVVEDRLAGDPPRGRPHAPLRRTRPATFPRSARAT